MLYIVDISVILFVKGPTHQETANTTFKPFFLSIPVSKIQLQFTEQYMHALNEGIIWEWNTMETLGDFFGAWERDLTGLRCILFNLSWEI